MSSNLRTLNHAYDNYRRQGLLKPPKLRLMRPGWLEALLHRGGYQAKPKIVGYQLPEAEYTERFIGLADPDMKP